MITQRSRRGGGSATPAWTRYFILAVAGITQIIPLLAGVYLVSGELAGSAGSFSAEKLISGFAFVSSAATMLYAILGDWRGGRRLNQSPAILAAIALLVVGMLVMMPASR